MVPVVLCITILVWTGAIGFFTVLASGHVLSGVLAGQYPVFFQSFLIESLRLIPFTIPLSFLFVFFYLMRHSAPRWLSIPLIFGLALVSVFVAIPLSWRLATDLSAMDVAVNETLARETQRGFDPGFIRRDKEGLRTIWFYSNADKSILFPVITVDPARRWAANAMNVFPEGRYDAETNSLRFDGTVIVESAGGVDPLLSTLTDSMDFLRTFRDRIEPALQGFRVSASRGAVYYYAETGSFFLAVISLWMLTGLTGWRLLNMMLSFVAFGSLFMVYPAVTVGPMGQLAMNVSLFGINAIPPSAAWYVIFALVSCILVGIPIIAREIKRKRIGKVV